MSPRATRILAAALALSATSLRAAVTQSTWTSPTDGTWTDPTRWSTNPYVPTNGNPSGTTSTATLPPSASPYALSLTSPISLVSLNLTSPATLTLAPGGSLSLTGTNLTPAASTPPSITFAGDVTLAGAGPISFDNPTYTGRITPSTTVTSQLTVGPDITIRTGLGSGTISRVANQGTLSAQTAGQSITVNNLLSNTGLLRASNNSNLLVSVPSTAALGPFQSTTGGLVRVVGSVSNFSLTLTAATGPLALDNNSALTGGTITSPDSTPFVLPSPLSSGSTLAVLDTVTLDTDLVVDVGNKTWLRNITFAGGHRILMNGGQLSGALNTNPAGTSILFQSGTSILLPATTGYPGNLGPNFSARTTTGDASIGGDPSTLSPNTTVAWTNFGSLTVTAGRTLALDGLWTNRGTVTAEPGSTLNLRGSFTTASIGSLSAAPGSLHLTGTLDNTGHILDLTPAGLGPLTLTAGTLRGGTVVGTLTVSPSSVSPRGSIIDAVTLASNVTLPPDVWLTSTDGLTLANSTLSLAGNSCHTAGLSADSGSLTGTGALVFDGGPQDALDIGGPSVTVGPNITLRTGAGSGRIGFAYITGANSYTPALTLQGTLSAQTAGQSITVKPDFGNTTGLFTNNGLVEARNGASLTFAPNLTLTNLANSTLTGGTWAVYDNSSLTLPVTALATAAATITLSGPNARLDALNALTTNIGSLTLTAGRSLSTQGNFTNSGTLTLGPSSSLTVHGTLSNPGTLDLTTGLLQLTSTPSDIRTQLSTHHLVSSSSDPTHTLGYLFSGEPTAPTSLTVRLTLVGDANLDGQLNADDYALIDRGFATNGTLWWQGDFNYDGIINDQDYLLIDSTYLQQQGGSPSPAFLSKRESQFGDAYVAQLLATVPEPSSLACLFAALLFSRRRRTSHDFA